MPARVAAGRPTAENPMRPVRPAVLAAALALLAASPAQAAFVTYTFTTDSSTFGGSLAGSFRVDQADLSDGVLSTADVRDFSFTFTDSLGGTTQYALAEIVPDIAVDPLTGVPVGIPIGLEGLVSGAQAGEGGLAFAFLTSRSLTPNESFWAALTLPSGATDSGLGHWQIGEANVVPAPGGALLGLVGGGFVALARSVRRRAAVSSGAA